MVLKNLALRIHSWMEHNLEKPFFEAEMRRAVPSDKKDGASTKIHFSVAAGLVLMICWLYVSVI